MTDTEKNRREASRYAVPEGTLDIKLPGCFFSKGTHYDGDVLDLSVTGCRILSPTGLPLRSTVELTFTLPDSPEAMKVKGTVHNNKTVEVDGKFLYELGIHFEGLKDKDMIMLRHRLRSGRVGERISERMERK